MSPAEQIKSRRKALGLDPGSLAMVLGITDASYDDLESYDDELETAVSIQQALTLSKALSLPLHQILFGQFFNEPLVSWSQLAELINEHLKSRSVQIEEFEDEVGWSISGLLSGSAEAQKQYPLMFLQDLSGVLGVPYHLLVPSHMA